MKFEMPIETRTIADLNGALPDLALAAQVAYDQWDQIDGFDEELGSGGICQDVAAAMASHLGQIGFEDVMIVSAGVGENHVFVLALLIDGVYEVDISPYHYESGGGYVWKKKPDVAFSSEMVSLQKIDGPISPDEFIEKYGDH